MLWYWLIFFSLLICVFLEQFTFLIKKEDAQKICFLYMILFIFLSTIRWNQDLGDWRGYYSIFNREEITSFLQIFHVYYWPFEPFYYLALRIIKYVTNSYTVLLLFMAIIANGCFYKAAVFLDSDLKSYTAVGKNKSTIITTYFAFWATCCANIFTVRTNMAVAICLMSIKAIEERKPWKFILMVVIACMFHFTALVFLIAYPIYRKKISFKYLLLLVASGVFIEWIGLDTLISLVGLLGGRYAEKVASYNVAKGSGDYSYLNYSGLFLIIRAMANSIFIFMVSLYIRRYLKRDMRYNGLFNLFLVGMFIQLLTISYNLEFARVAIFFLNIQFFILPYIFKISKGQQENKVLYFFGYSIFLGVKMYALLHSAAGYKEFTTILSGKIN